MIGDGVSKSVLGPENPWPGLNQFIEAHDEYFHGRDEEKAELFRLVKCETLTTLFGRSGLGKSSLLQAGLFPLLRQSGYLPVFIHIRHDDVSADGAEAAPLAIQVYASLREACAASAVEAPEIRDEETLWEYFHRAGAAFWDERNRLRTPVLVFDQFEEAFTLGAETSARRVRRDAFFLQLEELIENRPPQTLRERWDRDPELVAQFEQDRTPCKIVLSLREDFLPDLEQLKGRIRSIMGNRFRLERMDGTKAWQVVMGKRGELQLMEEDVALKIIDFVSRTRAGRDELPLAQEDLRGRTVDPALLSVVCSELNNRRRARHEQKISFTLVSDSKEEIIREFFDTHVNGLGPGAAATRRFIEEELITEGEGYRKRCALEEEMLRQKNVRKEDLRKLEQQRILRFEPSEGITWIELTHDLLTGVVRQSRSERRAREEKDEAEKKTRAARERIERAQQERRKRRWRRGIVTAAAVLMTVAIVVAMFFNEQARSGDWYRRLVATETIQAALAQTPPDMARARLMAESAANYTNLGYNRLNGYPYEAAVGMLGELPVFAPAAAAEYKFPIAQVAYSADGKGLGILSKAGSFWLLKGTGTNDFRLPDSEQADRAGASAPGDSEFKEGEPEKVAGFCFHPHGKPIVALRLRNSESAILYDYERKKEIGRIDLQGMRDAKSLAAGIAFSPDGGLLAVAASDNSVRIYSLSPDGAAENYGAETKFVAHTGTQPGTKKDTLPPNKPATAITFVWIGRTLQMVTANADGVWVWPDENEPGTELKGELHYERMVTPGKTREDENQGQGPDYSIIASAGGQMLWIMPYKDGNIGVTFYEFEVWRGLLGGLVGNNNEETGLALPEGITPIACAPDGQFLAIGTASNEIQLYRHGSLIQRIKLGESIVSLSFRPDGKVLAALSNASEGSGAKLSLFRLTSHGEAALKKRSMIAERIAISSNGLRLATVEGGQIRLCDAASGEVIKEKPTNNFFVTTLTVSNEGEVQAFALDRVRRPPARVSQVNTTMLATVWDVFGNDEQRRLEIGGRIDAVSGDGKWLVCLGKDGAAIEVVNLPNGESKPVVPQSTEDGAQRQMKQDGKSKPRGRRTIAISHSDQVIAVHDSGTGKIELYPNPWSDAPHFTSKKGDGGLVPSVPCAAALESLAFDPDDRLLFAATGDGDLLVFDLVQGEQNFIRHGIGKVTAMATSVSPSSPLLAMAVDGQPVCLWGEEFDLEEMQYLAGVAADDIKWRELSDDEKKAQRDKPLEPVDERTAAFWDAFWKTGRAVQQLKETATVADLEASYKLLREALSDEGVPDTSWQMKAMRQRLRFWKMLPPSAVVDAKDLDALRVELPRLEENERRIVVSSGVLSRGMPANPPAPGH